MRAWALAFALGGCGFSSSAVPGNGQDGGGELPPGDGPGTGSGSDAGAVHVCLGTFVQICADAPRIALSLMTGTIDTGDVSVTTRCLPYTAMPPVDACVIAGQSISIPTGNTVSATGTRRLILLAADTLSIAGTLDAASHRGGRTGPAADTGPCPMNAVPPTAMNQGGGGSGGTFGGPGNNGGNTPGGGMGGVAGSPLNITALGGGCPGSDGAGGNGGSGGHGGGAVLLLAGQMIKIDGVVNASGGGGSGGKAVLLGGGGGGGGGGSGGMIVLEAPSVKVPGKCFANGGGGGEGSSLLAGDGGKESGEPDSAGDGGHGLSVGGDGGDGGAGTTGSKPGGSGGAITNPVDTGGGGAGGGGVGIIKVISGDQDRTVRDPKKVAPPPS